MTKNIKYTRNNFEMWWRIISNVEVLGKNQILPNAKKCKGWINTQTC
jgi:hypothetical protein